MDDFSKYERLRAAGRTAEEVYLAGKADGIDEIRAIRMLRTVFGMTLREAKQTAGVADAFNQPQHVAIGGAVYWEGSDTIEGAWIAQAQVREIRDNYALVYGHRKFLVRPDGLVETEARDLLDKIHLSYFEKGLASRLQQSAEFWREALDTLV